MSFRETEINLIVEGLRSGQSLLVTGEPGSGKTGVATEVMNRLADEYTVAIIRYAGSAIDLLRGLCDQFGISTTIALDKGKEKQMTALQLKAELLKQMQKPRHLLIADDSHQWSAALKDWLQSVWRANGLMLLTGWQPQARGIFTKLPIISLEALPDEQIRQVMRAEAEAQGVTLSVSDLAALQGKAGNNPAIARRVIREAALGIANGKDAGHYQYVDGTPFLVVGLMCLGTIRLIGLGMGDRSIYIMGGLITIAGMALRALLYAANRGGKKL
jgi:KaiC/GvpD/RAD55 family RecA-like ATPase